METQEGIKRRARIGIQERRPQAGLADFANGKVLPLVSRIPETRFPVPRLEIIAGIPKFTAQTDIEELIPVSEFFVSWAGVLDAAEANTGRDRETRSIREVVWNYRVCNSERIERIGNWYTDALGTKE